MYGATDKNTIVSFRGEYRFLSNFYESPVTFEGITYTCAEAAFQAAKCADLNNREAFANLLGQEAKRKGRMISLREDWDQIKTFVMYRILLQKFSNPTLQSLLLETGQKTLIEGNTWGDTFWGKTPDGEGQNQLGLLLMSVREQYRNCSQSATHDMKDAESASCRIDKIIFRHGDDDYEVFDGFSLNDEEEQKIWEILSRHDTEGCSLRGKLADVAREIAGEKEPPKREDRVPALMVTLRGGHILMPQLFENSEAAIDAMIQDSDKRRLSFETERDGTVRGHEVAYGCETFWKIFPFPSLGRYPFNGNGETMQFADLAAFKEYMSGRFLLLGTRDETMDPIRKPQIFESRQDATQEMFMQMRNACGAESVDEVFQVINNVKGMRKQADYTAWSSLKTSEAGCKKNGQVHEWWVVKMIRFIYR